VTRLERVRLRRAAASLSRAWRWHQIRGAARRWYEAFLPNAFKRSSVAVVEAAIAAESASLDGYPAHWPRKSHAVVAKRRLNPKVRRSQQSKERTT
jgi:hypothetical protein